MKLADLKDELLADERSDVNDQLFDRAACKILHQELNISPNLAASDGFWRWLAVEKILRRHRGQAQPTIVRCQTHELRHRWAADEQQA